MYIQLLPKHRKWISSLFDGKHIQSLRLSKSHRLDAIELLLLSIYRSATFHRSRHLSHTHEHRRLLDTPPTGDLYYVDTGSTWQNGHLSS
jgi:hypothetical protein